ncbi:hypothetical protein LZ31DRAFT_553150 [Colletotrichum somersetense]|nr:hypothetical protein LZ31DRAFT_553150 [Colletotrichum somersetense]
MYACVVIECNSGYMCSPPSGLIYRHVMPPSTALWRAKVRPAQPPQSSRPLG